MSIKIENFLAGAFSSSDMLQSYIDIIENAIKEFDSEELKILKKEIENTKPNGIEETGAKAMILCMISDLENNE